MGNGASVNLPALRLHSKEYATSLLFKKPQMIFLQGLAESSEERVSFTNFIKSGSWLDEIYVNKNFTVNYRTRRRAILQTSNDLVIGADTSILFDYLVPVAAHPAMKEALLRLIDEEEKEEVEKEESGKTSVSLEPLKCTSGERHSIDSAKTEVVDFAWTMYQRSAKDVNKANVANDYFDLNQLAAGSGFTKCQMLAILFVILHPLHVRAKRTLEISAKETSRFCFMDKEGQCRCAVPCAEPVVNSAEACKAEELLLAAAAYFDEDRMLQVLTAPDWSREVPCALENCPLGIVVSAVREDGSFPILYSNHAMQVLSGYSNSLLYGKNLSILHGPLTEPEQIRRLLSAVQMKYEVRLALTCYRRNKSTFMNMLVNKPVVNAQGEMLYILSVCFDVFHRTATMQALQQVEALLVLIPLLLTSEYG